MWIDCEMTGLDASSDLLLEVACLVTDSELNVLDEGVDLVISAPDEALDAMVPVVREMHQTSGLTEAVRRSTVSLADAERIVLDYVRARVPEVRKAPLCGNSIATDRTFLARYMPSLDAHLHYRMIDVSSIKELARRWYVRTYYAAPAKRGGHRALADIQESIEELRYYRTALFVSAPGPGTEEARAIATEVRAQTDAAHAALAAADPAVAPAPTSTASSLPAASAAEPSRGTHAP
ncbi:oligoribonuclease [Frankia sp. AgB32]|nr:oligoribonuclease [Frankia sp. AgB32]